MKLKEGKSSVMESGLPELSRNPKDQLNHVFLASPPPRVQVEMVPQSCRNTRRMSGIIRLRASQNRTKNSRPHLPKTPRGSFRKIFFQSRSRHHRLLRPCICICTCTCPCPCPCPDAVRYFFFIGRFPVRHPNENDPLRYQLLTPTPNCPRKEL